MAALGGAEEGLPATGLGLRTDRKAVATRLDGRRVLITHRGRVEFVCAHWTSHLEHALQSALEATVLWATTLGPFAGRAWAPEALSAKVNVAAEYAAFTHQRALFELLTKTGKPNDSHAEPNESVKGRQVLGIAEEQVPFVDDVLGTNVFSDLNRACSHVGRRHLPASPPARPHLQHRVGWLTAVLLAQWDETRTDRLAWTGSDLSDIRVAIDAARDRAAGAADTALIAIDPTVVADWHHPSDPFAAWARR